MLSYTPENNLDGEKCLGEKFFSKFVFKKKTEPNLRNLVKKIFINLLKKLFKKKTFNLFLMKYI